MNGYHSLKSDFGGIPRLAAAGVLLMPKACFILL
jgi:hypothetical protein